MSDFEVLKFLVGTAESGGGSLILWRWPVWHILKQRHALKVYFMRWIGGVISPLANFISLGVLGSYSTECNPLFVC